MSKCKQRSTTNFKRPIQILILAVFFSLQSVVGPSDEAFQRKAKLTLGFQKTALSKIVYKL